MKRGFTLVEVLVVAAIAITFFGLIAAPLLGRADAERSPPVTIQMVTVQHDGHWWILCRDTAIHHPDCPCREAN